MSNMRGSITLTPRLPGAGDIFRSLFTSEARVRPFYTGTGSILLQPSLGGYHVLDVEEGEGWILEPGVYLASEGGVELGLLPRAVVPEPLGRRRLPGLEDDGDGPGRVAIDAPGPVETVEISEGELRVQGRLVLGRTDRPRLLLAALGAVPAQLHLRAAAAPGLSAAPARRWSAGRPTGTSTCTS